MKKDILDEIICNSKKLISFKTTKENLMEFDKAFEYIKQQLVGYYSEEIFINGCKNLIISNTKDKNLDIIFCTHIDVVPAEDELYIAKEIDGNLYGRGAFDMKSQISVIISLLKNNKTDKKVAFIITSDEEIGGKCCEKIIENYNSSLAIIPDGGKNFDLVIEEKGLLQIKLTTKGTTAHASEPYKGDNAIIKLIKLYEFLNCKYKVSDEQKSFSTTFNLSSLNGGKAVNMVPDEANMILDVRFVKENSIDEIMQTIKSFDEQIKVEILDQGPCFFADENNVFIKKFIKDSENILKRKIKLEKCVATCDAIYFSEKNIPTIIINPNGDFWHGPKEFVNIDSLYTLYEIFKKVL